LHSPQASSARVSDIAGLLVFSAIPFVAVQTLADSRYGKQLLDGLNARKPELQAAAASAQQERQAAQQRSRWYGKDRPLWLGPLSTSDISPEWLDGALPGDYGWDPLNLGKDRARLERYVELELLHARWAMLGALGALVPEALHLLGFTEFLEPIWWKVGGAKLHTGEDLNYLGLAGWKVAGGTGVAIIATCQFLLMFGPGRCCLLYHVLNNGPWHLLVNHELLITLGNA